MADPKKYVVYSGYPRKHWGGSIRRGKSSTQVFDLGLSRDPAEYKFESAEDAIKYTRDFQKAQPAVYVHLPTKQYRREKEKGDVESIMFLLSHREPTKPTKRRKGRSFYIFPQQGHWESADYLTPRRRLRAVARVDVKGKVHDLGVKWKGFWKPEWDDEE